MKTVSVLALCAVLAACSGPTTPDVGATFDVGLHRSVRVSGSPVTVSFDSVLEDSRCPIGALCVQRGRAWVRLGVRAGAGAFQPIELTDSSTVGLSAGWFVEFVDLLPRPGIGVTIDPNNRTVRLKVRPALD